MAASPLKLQITEWGLPPTIVTWFHKRGISSLFEWQSQCLCKNDVLYGGNLVYSAPTSAGKTLVADFLLLKRVLEYGKKALVIEPFVALTREKGQELKSMLYSTKARVGTFGGAYHTPGGMAAVRVAVCTIEKANNFINKLINESKLHELGIVVVDEIHYVGDERRGHQLELLLTKILYYNSQQDKNHQIQIVGLSATIPNLESIAIWLQASLYVTDFRPVPLVEKIKCGPYIYDVTQLLHDQKSKPIETVRPENIGVVKDSNDLNYLCIDSVLNGHSTLIFCESKRECEIMSVNLAEQIRLVGSRIQDANAKHVELAEKMRASLSEVKLKDVLNKLKNCPAGIDSELYKPLSFGVAFHHAGLTSEEREIIEDGFKGGAIKSLFATSTLSSGVNLPARRVIIKSPTMYAMGLSGYQKEMLNPTTYRQMIGRAGRKNIDTYGESILLCEADNKSIAFELVKQSLGDIKSSLAIRMVESQGEPTGLKKAVLEVIANGTVKTRLQLNKYLTSSFWLSESGLEKSFINAITATLLFLKTERFIEELKPGQFQATRLGRAIIASGLSPDDGLELQRDLMRAREGFILQNDLHIIYQVTPNDIARAIDLKDWQHYSKVWNDLDDICQNVGKRVGVDENLILLRCCRPVSSLDEEKERIYRRFWCSLIINDLINEKRLQDICTKYRVNKATVQSTQRSVAQFAGVMSIFCEELGYHNIAALVKPLEQRINFSCQRDLLDLIKLNITRPTARALYKAGYTNIFAVARADKLQVEFLIKQTIPFKRDEDELIWVPEIARNVPTLEYASQIVEAAKNLLYIEYGMAPADDTDRQRSQADRIVACVRPTSPVVEMIKPNEAVPNFELKYVLELSEVDEFIREWTEHSNVSLVFKVQLNEEIGCKFKTASGLELYLDNKLQAVTRLYACFDDFTVYIINSKPCLEHLRENLHRVAAQIDRINLFVQDATLTYRVLYGAFNFDHATLKRFQWQAFDVAWWVINGCPNRGTNNRNAQLSAVAKTRWATRYHHFLHPNLRAANSRKRSAQEFQRMKDIVKSGKTAILQPLLREIQAELEQRKQLFAYFDVEIPSRLTMAQPMIYGIGIDVKAMRDELRLYEELSQQLNEIAQQEYAKSTDISLTNIRHVARILYDDLGLKRYLADHSTNSDLSRDPTNGEILTILSEYHSFPKLVQDFRKIGKAMEALDAVEYNVRYNEQLRMKRVFGVCDFWQLTGRISMSEPDLFLVNRNFNVTIPAHKNKQEDVVECAPRRCFVPQQDWQFVAADYSQLELRLLAHFSRDDNLLEILNRSVADEVEQLQRPPTPPVGQASQEPDSDHSRSDIERDDTTNETTLIDGVELSSMRPARRRGRQRGRRRQRAQEFSTDVFKTVASRIYHKRITEVTDEDRQHAKRICYGIIYGMGTRTLANDLGIDIDQAETFKQDFFDAFPRIQNYTNELIERVEQDGFVKSIFGRRRNIEGINSQDSTVKARAHRVAINTRIQSSASDIIKLAMQKVDQAILEQYSNNARLVLEMHDELIYEVHPNCINEFSSVLQSIMESITASEKLQVKLLVNVKKGPNWARLSNA